MKKAIGLACGAVVALSSCSSGPAREVVLSEMATGLVVPIYSELAESTEALSLTVSDHCNSPTSQSLQVALDELGTVRSVWSKSEPVWVGPVMERESNGLIDSPVNVSGIDLLLADDTVDFTEDFLTTGVDSGQRGLRAIEYLLAETEAERSCDYLMGLTQVVQTETALVLGLWTDGEAPYADQFTMSDENGMDTVVNDVLVLLETAADSELGAALGAMGEEADLSALGEGPANLAAQDLVSHVSGIEMVLLGDGTSAGLSPLLSEELTTTLRRQIDRANETGAALSSPLAAQISGTYEDLVALGQFRDALTELQITISTEVVAQLGVTVGFSDADGDTGG